MCVCVCVCARLPGSSRYDKVIASTRNGASRCLCSRVGRPPESSPTAASRRTADARYLGFHMLLMSFAALTAVLAFSPSLRLLPQCAKPKKARHCEATFPVLLAKARPVGSGGPALRVSLRLQAYSTAQKMQESVCRPGSFVSRF